MGYVDANGILGYIGAPPCIANIDTVTNSDSDGVVMCSSWADCAADKAIYVYTAFKENGYDTSTPIGVAKDGHII